MGRALLHRARSRASTRPTTRCTSRARSTRFDACEHGLTKKEARRFERFVQYAIVASDEAMAQAGLDMRRRGRHARGLRVRHGHRRDRRAAERVFHLGREGAQAREPAVHPHDDRQHRGGQPVHPLRASGRVPERRYGLRHRGALHRLGRAGHPSRLHRRGPGRRLRRERLAHLPCRVRQPGRAFQGRRPASRRRCRSTCAAAGSWPEKAPARWCWSRWSMPRRAARRSSPR